MYTADTRSLASVYCTGLLLLGHASCYWRHSLRCLSWETGVSQKWEFQESWETKFVASLSLQTPFLLISLILSLQSRSLSQLTMLNYCWGTGHHSLPPAPQSGVRKNQLTQPQPFDVKHNVLKITYSK